MANYHKPGAEMTTAMTSIAAGDGGTTTAWFTLAGALAGVLITSAIALTTAVLNHRWQARSAERTLQWEHSKQLRQDRLEIYARYWSTWNRLTQHYRVVSEGVRALDPPSSNLADARARIAPDVSAELRDATSAWTEAYNLAFLIGGQEVVAALRAHKSSTYKRRVDAWNGEYKTDGPTHVDLTDAMRKEIAEPIGS
jgi:hypothetical protein